MYAVPSDLFYLDEGIYHWYVLTGESIDAGLSTHRALERKAENGCGVKTILWAKSGMMVQLQIVKSEEEEDNSDKDESLGHGILATHQLVESCKNSSRIVCRIQTSHRWKWCSTCMEWVRISVV